MNIFVLLIKISPFSIFSIQGKSMLPTFLPGERVIAVSLLFVHLQVEDVVICSDPRTQRVLIKRIVAIKNDSYFVEGDNKKESTDSRTFGWLKKKNIFAKVIYPKKVYNT